MMTNWKRFSLVAALMAAVAWIPAANAQRPDRGGGARSFTPPGGGAVQADRGAFRGGRGGEWRGGRGGEWRGGRSGWHPRRGWYPRRHSRVYYYPYAYPWGFYPYSWGYPYFGASASLYYGGYRPQVYRAPAVASSLEAQVQQRLAAEGYYRGAIDGIVGPQTRGAIRAFQRERGLRVTGRIDGSVLAHLGLRQARGGVQRAVMNTVFS